MFRSSLRLLSSRPSCFESGLNNQHIWLREECLKGEKRTPLVPEDAATLIADGYQITVEDSDKRIFPTEQYEAVGCRIVEPSAWKAGKAPIDAFILGLKTLGKDPESLEHRHIYFAHCFKGQEGWKDEIRRYDGGGSILDLEYLVDSNNRRLAAFGYYAGYAGMSVGIKHLAFGKSGKFPTWTDYPDKESLTAHVAESLDSEAKKMLERVVVVGAKGRVGRGACTAYDDVMKKIGASTDSLARWDIEEMSLPTARPALLEHYLLLNCVLLSGGVAPFITKEDLQSPKRILNHVVDVSCDPHSPENPLPFYHQETTFEDPALRIIDPSEERPYLDITAISHLPSLLPKESSEAFSQDLIPSLRKLNSGGEEWKRAESVFLDHLAVVF